MSVTIKQKAVPVAESEAIDRDLDIDTSVPVAARSRGTKPRKPVSRKPKKRGRPVVHKWPVFERVFSEMAKGRTVTSILAEDSTYPSSAAFYKAIASDAELKKEFEVAQQTQLAVLADESLMLIDAVRDGDVSETKNGRTKASFARDRLAKAVAQSRARQWLLSKLAPAYKDASKVALEASVDGVIVVTGGLPDQPLGELETDAERDAAIVAARQTRVITRRMIDNPYDVDVNREDGYSDADFAREIAEEGKNRAPKLRGEL